MFQPIQFTGLFPRVKSQLDQKIQAITTLVIIRQVLHRRHLKKNKIRTSVVPVINIIQWWAARLYKNTDFQDLRSIIWAAETYTATAKHSICVQLYSTSIILKQSFKTAEIFEKHGDRSILLKHKFPVANPYNKIQEQFGCLVSCFFKRSSQQC